MRVIDLTHTICEDMPVYPGTEPPKLQTANTIERDGFRETLLTMYSHTGTHMDAPAHLYAGRITLDAFHLFVLRTRVEELAQTGKTRRDLIHDARELGLPLLAGYEPLYRLPSVRSKTTRALIEDDMDLSPLPVCECASYEEGLWLEQFTLLSEKETLDQILQIFETLERRYFG